MKHVMGFLGLLALVCSFPVFAGRSLSTDAASRSIGGSVTTREAGGPRNEEGLIGLSGSIQPFVSAFNADTTIPRFVAILSPTCGACRHGVEAIKEVLSGRIRDGALRLLVVWAPMLAPDDEAAARKAASLFAGMPSAEFWDPGRRVGEAFRQDVFPKSADEMRRSLPSGHYLEATLAARSNDTPEWDIYMVFDPATRWTSAAPRPGHWVRQIARVQTGEEGLVSVMWRDSYARPPEEGSLGDQLKGIAAAITTPRR